MDGMLFSWADFVGGIRDFGEKIKPVWRASELIGQQRQTIAC